MKFIFQAVVTVSMGLLVAASPAAEAVTLGSGKVVTETRALGDFEAIAQDGSIDIVIRQAAKPSIEVQAEDNLLPLIETVVEPGSAGPTLKVRFKRGEWVKSQRAVQVTVDVVKLSAVSSSGSGDISIETLKTPSLKISLSGSADARMKGLTTDALEIHISGSGDVSAVGKAGSVKLSIAGSGDAELAALVADDVSVRIAGSGDAAVTANKSLDVSVAGSGDVSYAGDAKDVKTRMAGSGSLHRR